MKRFLGTLSVLMVFIGNMALAKDSPLDIPPPEGIQVSDGAVQEMDLNTPSISNSTSEQLFSGLDLANNEAPQNSTFSNDKHFPTPGCLTANVAFWEHIYRDIEVNMAVFHDKYSIGRVFGIATLPVGEQAKNNTISLYRAYFSSKLIDLANNLFAPERWDSVQKELAGKFSKSELNYQTLIEASQNIRVQTGLKSRFDQGVARSVQYLDTIQRIISQNNVPIDIIFLPHVESGYNPQALSKVGAAGLWQIMPNTMKLLVGTKDIIKRRDLHLSTKAAIMLLKGNYQSTKSWPLALTAYNHGLNGILNAVKVTKSKNICDIIARYKSPSFQFASSNFYAQFLAARNVAMEKYKILTKGAKNSSIEKILLAKKE